MSAPLRPGEVRKKSTEIFGPREVLTCLVKNYKLTVAAGVFLLAASFAQAAATRSRKTAVSEPKTMLVTGISLVAVSLLGDRRRQP